MPTPPGRGRRYVPDGPPAGRFGGKLVSRQLDRLGLTFE